MSSVRSSSRRTWRKSRTQSSETDGSVAKITEAVAGDDEEKILSLSPDEAVKKFDGKPLLAAGIVNSIDELIEIEGLKGDKN